MLTLRQRLLKDHRDFNDLYFTAVMDRYQRDLDTFPDAAFITVFGRSSTLMVGQEADLWGAPGFRVEPTTPQTMSIVSTSAEDAPGGAGLDGFILEGLDANQDPASEVLPLNGLTPVVTANTYHSVYRTRCLKFGATGSKNIGEIITTASSDLTQQCTILPAFSQSHISQFWIPRNYTGFITSLGNTVYPSDTSGATRSAITRFIFTINGVEYDGLSFGANTTGRGTLELQNELPVVVGPGEQVKVRTVCNTNNTIVGQLYNMVLVREDMKLETVFT